MIPIEEFRSNKSINLDINQIFTLRIALKRVWAAQVGTIIEDKKSKDNLILGISSATDAYIMLHNFLFLAEVKILETGLKNCVLTLPFHIYEALWLISKTAPTEEDLESDSPEFLKDIAKKENKEKLLKAFEQATNDNLEQLLALPNNKAYLN